jgi:hypothetical protein
MPINRFVTWLPETAAHASLQCHGWGAEGGGWLRQKVASTRVRAGELLRRLKAMTPDQWFLVGFALLLVAFVFVLLVQPSSVGRGGR